MRGECTGLFAEVLPKATKAPKLASITLAGVHGDPEPALKKRKKMAAIAPDVYDDHDYDD